MVSIGYRQTDIGVIPKDWDIGTVSAYAEITTGGRNTQDKVEDGAYPFFVRSQKVERINSWSFDGEAILTAGDGVGTGKVFHYINGKFDAHQRVYRIADFTAELDGYFFYLYFKQNFYARIMQMTAKSSVDSVRMEMIADMAIPLPQKSEQKMIAGALSDADALTESLEKLIAKKRLIKQGAMQELLTGKKRLAGFSDKWLLKPLGELFDFSGGVTASRDQLSTIGICYLHYGDIHLSHCTFVDVDNDAASLPKLDIAISKIPASAVLKDGDIVFVDASEDNEGASKHVVISNKAGIPYISGLHTIVAKAKATDINALFRRYCFQTEDIKRQFVFYAVGTKVTGISKTSIAKILLAYPPTEEEQYSIASILTDMDAELSALEQKLVKARQIKQGMMQELLTGRIRLI